AGRAAIEGFASLERDPARVFLADLGTKRKVLAGLIEGQSRVREPVTVHRVPGVDRTPLLGAQERKLVRVERARAFFERGGEVILEVGFIVNEPAARGENDARLAAAHDLASLLRDPLGLVLRGIVGGSANAVRVSGLGHGERSEGREALGALLHGLLPR